MDLWIRSQDKTRLVKVCSLGYGEHNEIHYINGYCVNEVDNYDLGTYKTKERALEVLDEIHGCIQTNAGFEMYSNLGHFSEDFNKKYNLVPVYSMPKE